jgi:hypothetical protein
MSVFSDMTREEKDEVIKSMKNPNWIDSYVPMSEGQFAEKFKACD